MTAVYGAMEASPLQTHYGLAAKLTLAVAYCVLLAACAASGGSTAHENPYLQRPTRQTWGLLPNGDRDKFRWPLASASLWNRAIGSGATYRPARIASTGTIFAIDPAVLIMTPTAPLTTLYYNGAAWTGRDRCNAGSKVLAQRLPIPTDFVVPSSLNNNSTAILTADGVHFDQNQPFTRCLAGGKPTSLVDFGLDDIYADGVNGAHGGSGLIRARRRHSVRGVYVGDDSSCDANRVVGEAVLLLLLADLAGYASGWLCEVGIPREASLPRSRCAAGASTEFRQRLSADDPGENSR